MGHTAESILGNFYDEERKYIAGETDGTAWLNCLAEDFKLHQSPDLPYGGVYEGRTGFKKWTDIMSELFSELDVTVNKMASHGETVIIHVGAKMTIRKNDETFIQDIAQIVTVDLKTGLITDFKPFYWDVAGFNGRLKKAGSI